MGRIRKKLYLSAKITESMRNMHGQESKARKKGTSSSNEDMPQMGAGQLKSLLRRGAQTLSHPEIDVKDMLNWDFATMLEKCKDRPSDPHIGEATATHSTVDEEKWLSVMEKVETAVFDGKRYQKQLESENAKNLLPNEVTRADRRIGKNTTVMMDGYEVSKASVGCVGWEAVPTLAGKDPRLAEPMKEKRPEIINQDHCQICWDGGEITLCSGCPRSYHIGCMEKDRRPIKKSFNAFHCPQHECHDCGKKTTDAGGLIYRCRFCPMAFCEDCLDWDAIKLVGETLPEYEMLGFPAVTQ
ncbi:hypothetical protein LTS18_001744, partial [Coniosporium uncinatum]